MKTAIVVLTYNRSAALLAVLRSLARQCGPDHEVLVADDGSRPEHVEALRRGLPAFSCRVRHVWHPDTGFTASQARNLAASRSDAGYIVFLDGDCVPTLRFVQMHERLAEAGRFVNGSRVLLSPELSRKAENEGLDLCTLGAAGWLRERATGGVNKLTHLWAWPGAPLRLDRRFHWKGIRSCNFGVWRTDLEQVNGFDETFCGWGHEDADLVLRLHNLGLARKDGFLATEVLHLWHPEQSRHNEGPNRQRVLDRLRSGMVRAERGLAEARAATDAQVTELN